MTPEDAFDALRLASNRLNKKLHDVALSQAETGALDTGDTHRRRAKSSA